MPNTKEKPMDRLTLPYQNGNGHYMKCCKQGGCSGICAYCEDLDKVVERLAWYEDMVANGVTFANDNNVGDKLTPTADKLSATEWISVDDRLPENDVMVIGYTPCDGFMFVGYYHEEPKYDWKVWRIVTAMRSTKVMTKKVTHWMPLPQPPKGE